MAIRESTSGEERAPAAAPEPEPWLRGTLADLHPVLAAPLYTFQMAREDCARWTEGLSDAQMWRSVDGLAPIGFHLRHIAGSTGRLVTYLQGRLPSEEQLEAARHEMDPGATRAELLDQLQRAFADAEAVIRRIAPGTLADPRSVGRKRLPTSGAGLVIHIAEHTQRHVGEAIITAKLLKANASRTGNA